MAEDFKRMQQEPSMNGLMGSGNQLNMGHQHLVNEPLESDWVQQFESMNMNSTPHSQFMQNNPVHQQIHHSGPSMSGFRAPQQLPMRPMPMPMMGPRMMNRPMNSVPFQQNQMRMQRPNQVIQPVKQAIQPVEKIETQTVEPKVEEPQSKPEISGKEAEVLDSDAIRKATEELVNVMSSDDKFKQSNVRHCSLLKKSLFFIESAHF